MKGWRLTPPRIHLKDPGFDHPLHHYDWRLVGKRLTNDPKKVTCQICLKGMAQIGGKQ